MSAWIVSKAHIDTLVQALITEGVVPMDQANETGRTLWAENLKSVASRYPRDRDGERPGPCDFRDSDVETYTFEGVEAPLDDLIVWHNVGCYSYQSCEHDEWDESYAHHLADILNIVYGARHGVEAETKTSGPWGIDDIRQAVKGVITTRTTAPAAYDYGYAVRGEPYAMAVPRWPDPHCQ